MCSEVGELIMISSSDYTTKFMSLIFTGTALRMLAPVWILAHRHEPQEGSASAAPGVAANTSAVRVF